MTEMNVRVETLVKRVAEKGRPMMSRVRQWQDDSRRYASQNALEALRWVKSTAEQAEKKISEWQATVPTLDASEDLPEKPPETSLADRH
jgi:hypothetical protein